MHRAAPENRFYRESSVSGSCHASSVRGSYREGSARRLRSASSARRLLSASSARRPLSASSARRPRRSGGSAGLALAVLAAATLAACGRSAAEPAGPNVLLVAIDTVRADHLGFHHYARDTSPVLDRLAEESVVFERAQASAPWTAPSLVSLMTSLYPAAHGVRAFPNPGRLAEETTTLAEALLAAGWRTGAVTEGGYARGDFGLDQGFEHFSHERADRPAGERAPTAPGESGMDYYQRAGDTVDRALAWLDAAGTDPRPFFLFVQSYEAHSPYRATQEWVRRFRPGFDEAAEHARCAAAIERWNASRELDRDDARLLWYHRFHCSHADMPLVENRGALMQRMADLDLRWETSHADAELVRWVTDLYDAEIAYLDHELGRLFAGLEERGLDARTLIVVTSDHGEGLGEHGEMAHGNVLYEEQLHVPLLFRLPPATHPDTAGRIGALVRTVDVKPTILALAGAPPVPGQGRSLAPLILGEAAGWSEEPAFSHALSKDSHAERTFTVRTGRWRLVRDDVAGTSRLYDLDADPHEVIDLAARHPKVVAQLEDILRRQQRHDAALGRLISRDVEPEELAPELLDELRRLGYVGD